MCPQGELVYVNYGRTEDFFKLQREMGINCTDKIVILRYGKIFRGNKVSKEESAAFRSVLLRTSLVPFLPVPACFTKNLTKLGSKKLAYLFETELGDSLHTAGI